MKKVILFFSAIMMLFASCAEKEEFTIKGKLVDPENDNNIVYLKVLGDNWNDLVTIDTATVANGIFEFKGLAKEGPTVHYLELAEPTNKVNRATLLIVEPGQIEVTLDSTSTIKGTPSNDAYQAYNDKMNAFEADFSTLFQKGKEDTTKVGREAIKKQFDEKEKEQSTAIYDYVKANIQNQIGAYVFASRSYVFSLDQMKEIFAWVKPEYKTNQRMQKLEARIQALDATSVGKAFVDLKGKTPEGKDDALANYAGKGKYVLIDFWASWCPPCRAEMPKLVELYKQYKDKDFEIVGISLDRTNDAWVKGIKDLSITWPQISDIKFWDSELAAAYGVNSIPHLVLLDKDGKILARGLSAEDATTKVTELLK
ncbi:TlpA disulfide reductase family protein [Prevotella sp. 10(H)]|uniref:TlpA disulfide reductase family protein n=1 Tax=Prevotella sp. 10(H) TaxID=1158294 RepID=UPI0004A6F023|nr:TlpA disulfide reductase family protein [Prevotella sp. 10(H)]